MPGLNEHHMIQYTKRAPSTPLQPFVEYLYEMVVDRSAERATWQAVTPDGCVELNICLGAPLMRSDAARGTAALPDAYLLNRVRSAYRIKRTGPSHVVGARFLPGGFTALMNLPVQDLADDALDAADVLGRQVIDLREQMTAVNNQTAIDALDRWLVKAVGQCGKTNAHVDAALARIRAARGVLSVEQLCTDLAVGRRRLEQCFAESIGASPKVYSRLVRFREVLARVKQPGMFDPLTCVVDLGYFDQPHLIREFKAFTGTTPSEYRAGYYPLNEVMLRGRLDEAGEAA